MGHRNRFQTSSRAGSFAEKKIRLPAGLEVSQKKNSDFQPGWKLHRKNFRLPAWLEASQKKNSDFQPGWKLRRKKN
ncbi:MAG: hypothetical protein LBQ65_08360, partial [Tannerellaceae bacterium]|nr:hypothetical protein [Tannerellaceae bacterium]